MTEQSIIQNNLAIIQSLAPGFKPAMAIVLGSGLGGLVDRLADAITIPYSALQGFPHVTVHGHSGNLILGYLNQLPVVCLQGRAHRYEGDTDGIVRTYVRTMKALGCEYFIATNAAGSMREEVGPGELVLITDHINLQPGNPLVGPNDETVGPRFLPLDKAYHPSLREQLLASAKEQSISLHEGVYVAVLGPNYETAAEIRAFRTMGGDMVGMSTVPEVLVANHCGLKVAVISIVTNYATGLSATAHSHAAVVQMAENAGLKLGDLLFDLAGTLR